MVIRTILCLVTIRDIIIWEVVGYFTPRWELIIVSKGTIRIRIYSVVIIFCLNKKMRN